MRCAVVLVVGLGLAQAAGAGPCGPGAQVDYPLTAVLDDEAQLYLIKAITHMDVPPDPDPLLPYATAYTVVLAERAADLPRDLHDLPYMIALTQVAGYPDPTHSLIHAVQATVLSEIAEAVERQGLTAEATLLRALMQPFPDWNVMAGFTEAEDEALYALTVWADDGMILDAMAKLADAAGLMPR